MFYVTVCCIVPRSPAGGYDALDAVLGSQPEGSAAHEATVVYYSLV